ncbi:MAG: Skp family chaperone for outer membrane protein [Rhodothermales bacterium]|jgi:Skp family chaperone for outer membrane proteins
MKIRLSILALLAASSLFAQGLSVAVVDMETIFSEYYKTIKSEIKLQQQNKIYREYAVGLERELEDIQKRALQLRDDSQNVDFSEAVRREKQGDLQRIRLTFDDKRQELRQYQSEKKQKVRADFEKSRGDIIAEIVAVVQKEAQRRNLDMALDSSGKTLNGIPAFVHFRVSFDITEAIKALLNAGKEQELVQLKAQREQLQGGERRR